MLTKKCYALYSIEQVHFLEDNMLDAFVAAFNTVAFTLFGAPTSWGEVIGFVTGAVCVYLVAKQHIANWPIGILNNIAFILLFTAAGLFADAGLQVVYIGLAIYGWYVWLHGGQNRSELPVSNTTRREWAYLIGFGVAATALVFWFLDTHTSSTVPLADALTTVLSLMATWGQTRKKLQSWYLWMLADLIYIPLYHHKGLTLTAILYVGFFALCVLGFVSWRKSLRESSAKLALTPAGPVETTNA